MTFSSVCPGGGMGGGASYLFYYDQNLNRLIVSFVFPVSGNIPLINAIFYTASRGSSVILFTHSNISAVLRKVYRSHQRSDPTPFTSRTPPTQSSDPTHSQQRPHPDQQLN